MSEKIVLPFIANFYPNLEMCVSRTMDAEMVANFRVQAELTAIESTEDGKCIVLGTIDGCLSVLAIADKQKPEMKEFLRSLPSRDVEVSPFLSYSTFDLSTSQPVLNFKFLFILLKHLKSQKIHCRQDNTKICPCAT
jgi:hypothetical protein